MSGWRENGANGYVWTFSTPTDRYFLRRGRGKSVVDEVLGDGFAGVLVGYAAYQLRRPQTAVLGQPASPAILVDANHCSSLLNEQAHTN